MKNLENPCVLLVGMVVILCGISSVGYAWVTNPNNGHQYALTNYGTWEQAEAEAVVAAGHLATINDEAENTWLATFIKDSYTQNGQSLLNWNLAWIGLYRDNALSTDWHDFKWVSGEPVTYFAGTPWINEPGKYAYLHGLNHYAAGTWFWDTTIENSYQSQGIIEVPEPATLSLLVISGLALLRRRK
ncbi:MAG: PEP-CTERM sorting domain-containing protein [Phycisphaerae bacterium]